MKYIKLLSSLIKLIPKLIEMWRSFRIGQMKKENSSAVDLSIDKKDQRELEKVINPSGSGLPSGLPGSEIVKELPGVPK